MWHRCRWEILTSWATFRIPCFDSKCSRNKIPIIVQWMINNTLQTTRRHTRALNKARASSTTWSGNCIWHDLLPLLNFTSWFTSHIVSQYLRAWITIRWNTLWHKMKNSACFSSHIPVLSTSLILCGRWGACTFVCIIMQFTFYIPNVSCFIVCNHNTSLTFIRSS